MNRACTLLLTVGLIIGDVCSHAEETSLSSSKAGLKTDVAVRRPSVPAGEGNEVDRFLEPYIEKHQVQLSGPISDEVFLRRVYLDLIGRLPTPEEYRAYIDDEAEGAAKRAKLVDRLLADDTAYADHWISFWQDLLRDGKQDLGSTDIFRAITPWLYRSLKENKALDRFTQELIDPPNLETVLKAKGADQDDGKSLDGISLTDDDPSGFLVGLRAGLETARGDQAWEVQAAQNLCQVFLGVPLKCATCHDSFVDDWTMDDAWNMAAIYADKPLEMVRCELPTGKVGTPHFLFPALGDVEATAPIAERRAQLARLFTSPENGRFARTLVNRIWAKLMGYGLVGSLEDMSQPCWHPELLDYLAADLIDHGFDARHLIRRIVTSEAYALPAVDITQEADATFVFRGPALKRLTAEQYLDGIHALVGRETRVWRENGSKLMEILGRPDHRTVVMCRDSKASTMQSLELLNGEVIHELIYGIRRELPALVGDKGLKTLARPKITPPPEQLLAKLAEQSSGDLVDRLAVHALSRRPTDAERRLLLEIVGEKPMPESVGDLVWVIVNLPEFQLVR